MSVENPYQRSARGGCLDAFVGVVTMGRFGVETTAEYGLLDGETGEIFQETPIARSFKTGRPVLVDDLQKTRHVSRRIVRNKRV